MAAPRAVCVRPVPLGEAIFERNALGFLLAPGGVEGRLAAPVFRAPADFRPPVVFRELFDFRDPDAERAAAALLAVLRAPAAFRDAPVLRDPTALRDPAVLRDPVAFRDAAALRPPVVRFLAPRGGIPSPFASDTARKEARGSNISARVAQTMRQPLG
jgi:hypothetical protein